MRGIFGKNKASNKIASGTGFAPIKTLAEKNPDELVPGGEPPLSLGDYIKKGVIDINVKDSEGKTLLHYCAENGNITLLKWLLSQKNIAVNQQDNKGNTPLHIACYYGNAKAADALLLHKKVKHKVDNVDSYRPGHSLVRGFGEALHSNPDDAKRLKKQYRTTYKVLSHYHVELEPKKHLKGSPMDLALGIAVTAIKNNNNVIDSVALLPLQMLFEQRASGLVPDKNGQTLMHKLAVMDVLPRDVQIQLCKWIRNQFASQLAWKSMEEVGFHGHYATTPEEITIVQEGLRAHKRYKDGYALTGIEQEKATALAKFIQQQLYPYKPEKDERQDAMQNISRVMDEWLAGYELSTIHNMADEIIHTGDVTDMSPLDYAVKRGNYDLVTFMLEEFGASRPLLEKGSTKTSFVSAGERVLYRQRQKFVLPFTIASQQNDGEMVAILSGKQEAYHALKENIEHKIRGLVSEGKVTYEARDLFLENFGYVFTTEDKYGVLKTQKDHALSGLLEEIDAFGKQGEAGRAMAKALQELVVKEIDQVSKVYISQVEDIKTQLTNLEKIVAHNIEQKEKETAKEPSIKDRKATLQILNKQRKAAEKLEYYISHKPSVFFPQRSFAKAYHSIFPGADVPDYKEWQKDSEISHAKVAGIKDSITKMITMSEQVIDKQAQGDKALNALQQEQRHIRSCLHGNGFSMFAINAKPVVEYRKLVEAAESPTNQIEETTVLKEKAELLRKEYLDQGVDLEVFRFGPLPFNADWKRAILENHKPKTITRDQDNNLVLPEHIVYESKRHLQPLVKIGLKDSSGQDDADKQRWSDKSEVKPSSPKKEK